MRFLSVCSGIEAASVAWEPLGWKASAFSEIEPFPSAVLAHYHQDVPNLGDMTGFKGWPDAAINVLVGGTPCQSFSVAGLRKGLADPRGNLALTYLAIAARYRPRWVVWENVPGVLSSAGGRDFASFLGGLGQLGYGWAYRVLDAQFFGVAQRRRRVFVVGCLGGWASAGAVLFESESLRGDIAPSREAGQIIANSLVELPDRGGGNSEGQRLIPTIALTHTRGGQQRLDPETETLIPVGVDYTNGILQGAVSGTLEAAQSKGNRGHGVLQPVAFDSKASGRNGFGVGPISPTPRAMGHKNSHSNAGGQVAIAFAQNQRDEVREMSVAGALAAEPGAKQQTYVQQSLRVRRLTPRECERLQGFPDDYTLIPYRGKPAADGLRYKALGNSMAVPVMSWIGRRIAHVEQLTSASRRAA